MLSFSDAPKNLFNLIGRLGGIAKKLRTYQNDVDSIMTDTTNGVVAHTKEEADVQAIMGGGYLGVLASTGGSVTGVLQSVAAAYVNRLVYRDSPRLGQTLTSSNTSASIGEVIRQMGVAGATVRRHTVAGTVSTFTGDADAAMVVSVRNPVTGLFLENLFAETITVVCTQDSYLGGATAGNETLGYAGTGAQNDPFAFDWPLGSGASGSLSVIDGDEDDSAGNLLTNSGFEAFTSNVPDNWELNVGIAGTDVLEEVTIIFDPASGGKSLELVGDGVTLTQIRQLFDDSDGTTGTLSALTQYSVCLWAARDGTAANAGTLTIDLFDGTNVVKDQNGADNTFDVDLTTLGTGFSSFTGVFRTPLKMPAAIYVRLRLSVALESGRSVFLDKLSMGEMTQLYSSGPFAACHAGAIPFVTGDYAFLTFTNSRGSGGSLDTFQTLLSRLFASELLGSGLQFPSSDVPTISDSALIF